MSAFPSITAFSKDLFSQQRVKAQIKTEFENGAVQSRARHTSARWIFIGGWVALRQTEFNSLVSHFDDNQGGMFDWTHPITSAVHEVRYSHDHLPPAKPAGFVGGEIAWRIEGLQLEEK